MTGGGMMNIIAANIARRRKELKMTQKEMAEKLGISDKTISRWETGSQIPDALTIPQIAQVLQMTIDELYGQENVDDLSSEEQEEVEESDVKQGAAEQFSAQDAKEYANLQYTKILIFKLALLIGVFLFFIDATMIASNLIFASQTWKLVMIFGFVGILLYFIIIEVVFVEFYKRKELALYYERENVKWMGAALLALNLILSVWMPFLQEVNGFWPFSYAGVTATVIFNLVLLLFGIFYRLRMKKQQFDISLGNWIIPGLIFFMGIIMIIRYMQYASQTSITASAGWYNALYFMINGIAGAGGGYIANKLRMMAVLAGFIFVLGQAVNYFLLTKIWKQKIWDRKKEFRVVLALGLVNVLCLMLTLGSYGTYSVYDLYAAKMDQNKNINFKVETATIGINFSDEGGQMTYFNLNKDEAIDELLDRLSEIRVEEKDTVDEEEEKGRTCFIHLRGQMRYTMDGGETVIDSDASDNYWKITLNEDGAAYYEGEIYSIKGKVDWDGLYELALSEYNGQNLDLYKEWLSR